MPFYTYQNEDGETIDKFFKINDRPQTIVENGIEYSYIISTPAIVAQVGGYKVPSIFRDKLRDIKKHNPGMKSSIV